MGAVRCHDGDEAMSAIVVDPDADTDADADFNPADIERYNPGTIERYRSDAQRFAGRWPNIAQHCADMADKMEAEALAARGAPCS